MESTLQIRHNLEIRKPTPSSIVGLITSLSYQESGNNLVEIKVQENNLSNIFTLTAYCNVQIDHTIIKIVNLNEFQFRLQEAFNHQYLVNIYQEDGKIILLEISRLNTIALRSLSPSSGGTTWD